MTKSWTSRFDGFLSTLLRRGALFILGIFTAGSLTLAPITTPTASADGILDPLISAASGMFSSSTSCAIETVGWIVCPTMRTIAKMADYGFTYINQTFLKIDYSITATSTKSGTYKAWDMMRLIANALFVVAFMILVYSQLTGRGGTYSIKRLLPKLVLAAIFVNVSFWLFIILVDVANILGDSLMYILASSNGVPGSIGAQIMPVDTQTALVGQDGALTRITSAVLSKGSFAWVLLTPVAAVIISVATICAVGVILLILRKVMVSVLILLSPVLFVMYLLPNLERFFFQGIRLFLQLLIIYPIVAILLGAGQIVSATIVSVGTGDTTKYAVFGDNYGGGVMGSSGNAITDMTAAAAAVLPLIAVWWVFKSTSNLMSTAGARLTASVSGGRSKGDENARVTGNATAGARLGPQLMAGLPQARRQAFSRGRRKSSLGGSSLTSGGAGRSAEAGAAAGEALNSTGTPPGLEAAGGLTGIQNRPEKLQDAKVESEISMAEKAEANTAESDSADVKNAVAEAAEAAAVNAAKGGGSGGSDENKQITAKDIFNNMNREHKSKDSERKFGAGPGGGNGGGGGGGVATGPTAPVVAYKAPDIASTGNFVTGTSAASGQTPVQVVAVPIQVDGASLLTPHTPVGGLDTGDQPSRGTTEEKAKNRVQKYLFDTQKDLDDARDREDVLGRSFTHTGDDKDKKDDK